MTALHVEIYTTRYCPYCRAAKDFLKSKGVSFKEIDVTDDDETRTKLVQMTGQETVPQLFANGKSLGGYENLVRYYQSGKSLT